MASHNNSRVQRARPGGGFEQAVAISRASSRSVSLRAAPQLQIALDETALGASHRRQAADHPHGNLRIRGPLIRGQEDLRPLQTAGRLPPASRAFSSSRSDS